MAIFTPPGGPGTGRPDRLPDWDRRSPIGDWTARFRAALAAQIPFLFDSAKQAKATMLSDGASPLLSPFFGVAGDAAVYTMATGEPVRIGVGLRAAFRVVTFTFPVGATWSPTIEISLGDDLGGQPPHAAFFCPLVEPGAVYSMEAKVNYAGAYDKPDWNATRVIAVASVAPAPSAATGVLTRAALFVALRGED